MWFVLLRYSKHLWCQDIGLRKPNTSGVLIHGILHIMDAKELSWFQKERKYYLKLHCCSLPAPSEEECMNRLMGNKTGRQTSVLLVSFFPLPWLQNVDRYPLSFLCTGLANGEEKHLNISSISSMSGMEQLIWSGCCMAVTVLISRIRKKEKKRGGKKRRFCIICLWSTCQAYSSIEEIEKNFHFWKKVILLW